MRNTTSENKNPESYCLENLEDILLKMISYEAELKLRATALSKLIEKSLETKDKDLFIKSTNEIKLINEYLKS